MKRLSLIIFLISIFIFSNHTFSNEFPRKTKDSTIAIGVSDLVTLNKYYGELYNEKKEAEFTITPSFSINCQYFINNNLSIGGMLNGQYKKRNKVLYVDGHGVNLVQKAFGGGPLARYYFKTDRLINPYLGLSYSYFRNYGEYYFKEIPDNKVSFKSDHHQLAASLGLNFILMKSFSIAFSYNFIFDIKKVKNIYRKNESVLIEEISEREVDKTRKYKSGHMHQFNFGLMFYL